jgi:predicted nucleotidyltransferase
MKFSNLPIGLSELEEAASKFKREHEKVFDVVLYGSTTQGKDSPNDFDFMVVLRGADDSERFELSFEFKEMLVDMGFPHEKLDVKAINLEQMWNPNYLAVPG